MCHPDSRYWQLLTELLTYDCHINQEIPVNTDQLANGKGSGCIALECPTRHLYVEFHNFIIEGDILHEVTGCYRICSLIGSWRRSFAASRMKRKQQIWRVRPEWFQKKPMRLILMIYLISNFSHCKECLFIFHLVNVLIGFVLALKWSRYRG